MALIIVAGASGQHAAVVYEAAILAGLNVAGFATIGSASPVPLFDCRWVGDVERIAPTEIQRGARFVVACGANALRRQISEALLDRGASLQEICHPAAIISPSASIGAGSTVLAGAIVGPRAVIGRGVIVNHAASVDHDCKIGDYGNFSPGARFAGGVRAGAGVFAGMNAAVLPGLVIGENAVIGAGAVVIRDVAASDTVVGIPARPIDRAQAR